MLILIVEDEPIVAICLRQELEAAGHTVIGAADSGAEAILLSARHHPTLALLDTLLHDQGNGVELARILKRDFAVVSVFVTAEPALARANADAALGLVTKPYLPDEMCGAIETIADLLRGQHSSGSTGILEVF